MSAPNALIGSRYQSEYSRTAKTPEGAYFEIADSEYLAKDGLQSYFTLLSLYIKPLTAPESGTNVIIKGYSHAREEPLIWEVYFASDYHEPLLVKIQEFSKVEWSQLYGVEILADYGEDLLDWEFCVDDLELQFFKIADEELEGRPGDQQILEPLERGL